MKTTQEIRESKKWWAVVDGSVQLVTGYSCAPNNPGMWWCPEAGLTISEKHHLFNTELEAVEQSIREMVAESVKLSWLVDQLKKRRKELIK